MAPSVEFPGPNREEGWSLAGVVVPLLYVVWSVWLLGLVTDLVAPLPASTGLGAGGFDDPQPSAM